MSQERRMVLLAGASGSGKSRLAAVAGCPRLNLDDFYRDHDHPDMPRLPSAGRSPGTVDWDDPASWDLEAALAAVVALCRMGSAKVPVYDISQSRRVGEQQVELGAHTVFVAEGVFAPQLVGPGLAAALPLSALYLDRRRSANLVRRFLRDVAEHRKPLPLLLRRGMALWRQEPLIRSRALAAGCRPVSFRLALAELRTPPATTPSQELEVDTSSDIQ